jgi:uncharacterized protein (PEP-CTERM system associated)
MAIMAMDTVITKKSCLLFIYISLLLSRFALAGEWQFTPGISINETYSDNVTLKANDKINSLVSQTMVNIDSSYVAQHALFNLSSTSTYAFYSHDHDKDKGYIDLASNFAFQLWPNGITLLGGATIENKAQNDSKNALADLVSADTTQLENYNLGVGYDVSNSDFTLNTVIRYQITQAGDNVGEQQGYLSQLNSSNGSSARTLFWDVSGSYQELENDTNNGRIYQSEVKIGLITDYRFNPFVRYYNEGNSGNIRANQSIQSNAFGLGLRWLVTDRLLVDVSYNKPEDTTLNLDGKPQNNYINATARWQPSIRSQLETSYSQRFYGDSYGFNFTHSNKRLTNNISYVEAVESFTRNSFESIPQGLFWCPNSNTEIIDIKQCFAQSDQNINFDDFSLVTFNDFELVEDNQFSLNKTLNWTSTLALAKTTLILALNGNERENLTDQNISLIQNARVDIKRQISGKSFLNLSLSYLDNHLQKNTDNKRRDRYRQYQLAYQRNINNSLTSEVNLSYIYRSSDQQSFNYQEGRFNISLSKDF